MTNELILPGIAGTPSKRFQNKPAEKEEIGAGIGVGLGYKVIGPQGRAFQLYNSGDTHILTGPDNRPLEFFDIIILRGGRTPSHTWYKQGYKPGSEQAPDCVSTDGIGPDDVSPLPQAKLCQTCVHHEWKVQPSGRKGRACTDSLRLAVFIVSQAPIQKAIGRNIQEPVLFRVPAASMAPLKEFLEGIEAKHGEGMQPWGYITRVFLRQDVPHAQYTYQAIEWLADDMIDRLEEIREDEVAYRIMGKAPDGRSLVRKAANDPQPINTIVSINQGGIAAKLEAERLARIAAVRAPEAKKEDIQPQVPLDEEPRLRSTEAPPDVDALVAAMRPRPPQG